MLSNTDNKQGLRVSVYLFLLGIGVLALWRSVSHAEDRPCLNPFSTVDWSFFFDKLELKGGCICPAENGLVKIGLKWTVPEPIGFVEVVKKSWNYPCVGFKLGDTLKLSGTNYSDQGVKKNVHYIKYPVFGILNIILDYLCVDKNTQFDIAPPSELDPRQNDDMLSNLFQYDKLLYSNPIAQSICFFDCAKVSTGFAPINSLYWCAGCWGTLGNTVTNSYGNDPVVESALLAVKQLDLLHADFQLWKYSDPPDLDYVARAAEGFVAETECSPKIFPRVIKSQYHMNLSYPVSGKAIPIGNFGIKWSFFKQYPGNEDFIWTIWRVRNCCMGFQFP